jgi:hypothetical protein
MMRRETMRGGGCALSGLGLCTWVRALSQSPPPHPLSSSSAFHSHLAVTRNTSRTGLSPHTQHPPHTATPHTQPQTSTR